MRDAMLSVCPIDNCSHAGTMGVIGREDRALLRSNPNARTDAGTWTGVSPSTRRLSALNMFWPQSEKPRGFGGRAPKTDAGMVCQLSRSLGLGLCHNRYPGLAALRPGLHSDASFGG